jgi:hypothetical protein
MSVHLASWFAAPSLTSRLFSRHDLAQPRGGGRSQSGPHLEKPYEASMVVERIRTLLGEEEPLVGRRISLWKGDFYE